MSRPRTPSSSPLELDLSAVFDHERGYGRSELLHLGPRLELARQRLIEDAAHDASHWLNWPRRLLEDHQARRQHGSLTRWLTAAKHLRQAVNRAVIVGSPQSISVLKAIFAACSHPHHNDLPAGERGGRPRIFFASPTDGNDALQALFDVLPQGSVLHDEEQRWGIVAMDDGHESELLTPVFKLLWDALLSTTEPGDESERALTIGPDGSHLVAFAEQANLPRLSHFSPLPLAGEGPGVRGEVQFDVTSTGSGVDADVSSTNLSEPWRRLPTPSGKESPQELHPFHPGILLAAAVMNVDVVQYLFGAVTITDCFLAAPPGDNPALDFAGCRHLLAERRGIHRAAIDCPAELKPLANCWQCFTDQPYADDTLLIQWQPTSVRRDRLRVTMPAGEAPSGRKKTLDRFLPDACHSIAEATLKHRTAAGLPTAVLRMQTVDEAAVGQLLQLKMLADAVIKTGFA